MWLAGVSAAIICCPATTPAQPEREIEHEARPAQPRRRADHDHRDAKQRGSPDPGRNSPAVVPVNTANGV